MEDKPFGIVGLTDGQKITIDETTPEVQEYLKEFPDATLEVAIGTVVDKMQAEENEKVTGQVSDEPESEPESEPEVE